MYRELWVKSMSFPYSARRHMQPRLLYINLMFCCRLIDSGSQGHIGLYTTYLQQSQGKNSETVPNRNIPLLLADKSLADLHGNVEES